MPQRRQKTHGSFNDLDRLLAELDKPAIMELGYPPPEEKFLPRSAARCPAEHNRMLLDEAES
ncbi:MAG TPA: hypothetical protein VGE68_02790 [Sphingomicrobium sp.]